MKVNLPDKLQNHYLDNGQILINFVKGDIPTRFPVNDVDSLSGIWKNRLDEARIYNLEDLRERSEMILQFLINHKSNISLIVWPKFKISVLLDEVNNDYVIIDETSP